MRVGPAQAAESNCTDNGDPTECVDCGGVWNGVEWSVECSGVWSGVRRDVPFTGRAASAAQPAQVHNFGHLRPHQGGVQLSADTVPRVSTSASTSTDTSTSISTSTDLTPSTEG